MVRRRTKCTMRSRPSFLRSLARAVFPRRPCSQLTGEIFRKKRLCPVCDRKGGSHPRGQDGPLRRLPVSPRARREAHSATRTVRDEQAAQGPYELSSHESRERRNSRGAPETRHRRPQSTNMRHRQSSPSRGEDYFKHGKVDRQPRSGSETLNMISVDLQDPVTETGFAAGGQCKLRATSLEATLRLHSTTPSRTGNRESAQGRPVVDVDKH
ncbi:hypothetical protein Purlil1_9037 [Purpureocillium lilacinum]|uniref:Uncharacterized protein n=1 Tax=Purpureocillium lilacinum TaxID=33203 RepID=A0ABR0BRQ0_PURLI|nr:hypothetical protein Purlil1_9037 [Purpureocillium lilacinum]